jgi:hypothetical protein
MDAVDQVRFQCLDGCTKVFNTNFEILYFIK